MHICRKERPHVIFDNGIAIQNGFEKSFCNYHIHIGISEMKIISYLYLIANSLKHVTSKEICENQESAGK